jgi:hypothetical protein
MPLAFAAASASEVHALLRGIWPAEDRCHILHCDHDATSEALQKDVDMLEGQPPFDLFLVYMAGHGRVSAAGFSFVLAGHRSASEARTGDLDGWFLRVPAHNRLVVIDACNAGRFLDATDLVRATGDARAAFVLTAATREQRAWEDPFAKRTLLADALIHGLTGDISGSAPIDVPAQMFPFVSDYVTRHAFALKAGALQEPVWGGVAGVALALPVGRASARSALTTGQVLLRRTRQIVSALIAVAIVILVAVFASTWRPALHESGSVELRAGPKWLSPLNVGPWARRVETDIGGPDLVPTDAAPAVLDALRNERGVHPWFGRNPFGLRRWIDVALPWMTDDAAMRWRIRLDTPRVDETLLATGRFGIPTVSTPRATQFAAEHALLRNAPLKADAWERQWRERAFGAACGDATLLKDVHERAELFVETTTPEASAAWLEDFALAARTTDAITVTHILALAAHFHAIYLYSDEKYRATLGATDEPLTARRIAAAFERRPARQEVDALADLADAIAARRRTTQRPATSPTEVRELTAAATGPCRDWVVPVLAALGPYGAPSAVSAWARTRQSSDQGRRALGRLAEQRVLAPEDIEWLLGLFGFGRDDLGTKQALASAGEWLTSVAEHEPLPPPVLSVLLEFAARSTARGDTDAAMRALLPVAWSANALAPDDQATLRKALRSLRQGQPLALINVREVELWGIAAAHGVIDSAVIDMVFQSVLEGASPPTVVFTTTTKNGAEQLAAGWKREHIVALARIAMSGSAESPYRGARVVSFLEHAARDAFRAKVAPDALHDPYAALAALHLTTDATFFNPAEVHDRLVAAEDDAGQRAVVLYTLVAYIDGLSPAAAERRIEEFRPLWKAEREPDLKYALATALLEAERHIRLARFPP